MPLIPIDRVIDKSLYAKQAVNGYAGDFQTVNYAFAPKGYIGKIYSWVTDKNNGQIYFMVYVTNSDFVNFRPTFVKANSKEVSILELPDIIKQIEREKEAENIKNIKETKGLFGYYVEKYVPTILAVTLGVYVLKNLISIKSNATK